MARDEFGLNRELGRGKAKGFASDRFGNSIDFEEYVGRTDDSNPGLERPFAFTHSGFEGFLGEGFLGEDTDPHFAVPLHIAGNGYTRGFNLLGIEPAPLEGHEAKLTKSDRLTARGKAGAITAVHFAVLNSFGHQRHKSVIGKQCFLVWEIYEVVIGSGCGAEADGGF